MQRGLRHFNMIKKIHCCWFGSPIPDSVRKQILHWQELCPDFEIHVWNDLNVDYSDFEYWRRVYKEKRWGFASDIVSFAKVFEMGGFYLDCDVLMNKPLIDIPAPHDHLIMGYMYDCALSGGFFYAPKGHNLISKILEYYKDIAPHFYAVNNTIITDCINNNVDDFLLNGRYYTSEKHKLTVFPKEYFCQPSFFKNKPFCIDQFAGSWKDGSKGFTTSRPAGIVQTMRRKLSLLRSLYRNEFFGVYKKALLGLKIKRTEHWRSKFNIIGGAVPPMK